MSAQLNERELILARLDAILREVTAIRLALLGSATLPTEANSFTERLIGCLGSEQLKAYDFSLDWVRFAV